MRMIFGLVLVVGLGLAGMAVWMVQGYIAQAQHELAREQALRLKLGDVAEAYGVIKPLAYGQPLKKGDVAKVLFPVRALPEGTFRDEASLFPGDYAKPRYLIRAVEKNEILTASRVTEPGEDAGLTTRLTRGMRAFAVKVDVASGVSGFVKPGDTVDVYWTGNNGGSSGEITQLIESTVKVVAVDQAANDDRTSEASVAQTVTVEVTPQQVGRLAQAAATGRLALSLVGIGDTTTVSAVEVDNRRLLGIETAAPIVQAQVEKVCTVRTRKGSEVVEIPVPCTN